MQRYVTRDDVLAPVKDWHATARSCVRKLVMVQAATVVGTSGVLFVLLRFF